MLNFKKTLLTRQKKDQLTCSRYCRKLSDITALCYPTFTTTSRLQPGSFLHKTYGRYQHHPQCIWQLKSCSFERSLLNGDKYNTNCILKEILLVYKIFFFPKTQKSGCTRYATHFTSVVTGHIRFSVVAEHN